MEERKVLLNTQQADAKFLCARLRKLSKVRRENFFIEVERFSDKSGSFEQALKNHIETFLQVKTTFPQRTGESQFVYQALREKHLEITEQGLTLDRWIGFILTIAAGVITAILTKCISDN